VPKYLIQARYTPEGTKGLREDKASGRKTAVTKAVEGLKGKVEAMYYAFGEDDAIVVMDLPDNVSAAAISLAVAASGLIHTRTTPLLTIEEMDQALQKTVHFRPPGR
jgi:uncharacterized protein with GYD domain